MMIPRNAAAELSSLLEAFPIVTLTGPRQSGKTTLARAIRPDKPYQSLEDPDVRQRALTDPRGFLAGFRGGAILDEVQRAPELLSYLQTIVDEDRAMGAWILTGSAQFQLLQGLTLLAATENRRILDVCRGFQQIANSRSFTPALPAA
jgi:predicted AAA+ superfamily ATPase